MSEDTMKSLINLVPKSIDNAAKNLTDKPTQNMGTTLADIWYLVFGGISQAAEKRKLKYSYALQEFEKELKEKISKIPEDKLIEPNIQIIAKALENAKYCVEEEELRHMFSSLISSTMNKDFSVTPVMVEIVSLLSPTSAKILNYFFTHTKEEVHIYDLQQYLKKPEHDTYDTYYSLFELEHLNLIYSSDKIKLSSIDNFKDIMEQIEALHNYGYRNTDGTISILESTMLSSLGYKICSICLQ